MNQLYHECKTLKVMVTLPQFKKVCVTDLCEATFICSLKSKVHYLPEIGQDISNVTINGASVIRVSTIENGGTKFGASDRK